MQNLLQQLNLEMSVIVQGARQSLVKISNGRNGAGAGTIWHEDGLIITNAHVVRDKNIEVILADGRSFSARVLAYDAQRDLAALSINAKELPTIALGDSNRLQPGQLVFAVGHPWGVTGAVSAGPLIALGPPPELPQNGLDFLQAGLQLRPGHSGGPMIDVQGHLIGINTMITGPEVGLAVPVQAAKAFLQQTVGRA